MSVESGSDSCREEAGRNLVCHLAQRDLRWPKPMGLLHRRAATVHSSLNESPLVSTPIARVISALAYRNDQRCRMELSSGDLTGERDYVSALLIRMRDDCKSLGMAAAAATRTLDAVHERRFGCDGLIIIRWQKNVKICLFEAKLVYGRAGPRRWDYVATGTSHFSDQLRRQETVPGGVIVWEQFALGIDPGRGMAGFDMWGATCLERDEVVRFDRTRTHKAAWNWNDLTSLCRTSRARGRSIGTLLDRVTRCAAGAKFPVRGRYAIVTSANQREDREPALTLEVPATMGSFEESAPALLADWGLTGAVLCEIGSVQP